MAVPAELLTYQRESSVMPATIIDDPIACDECDGQVTDTVSVDGHLLCDICADRYPICEDCDSRVESTVETVDGDNICSRCREIDYFTCDCCDSITPTLIHAADGQSVCRRCEDNCYWWCDYCDNLVRDGAYCDCSESEWGHSSHIHDCYYKPAPDFHGTGPVYLGFELEISTADMMLDDCAGAAVERLGTLGYLKSDSTINAGTGYGFELVTHPMSYDWALANFPWPLLAELADADCSGDGNGLHVHVSRAAFSSPAHIYRWMKLFYRNEHNVISLARRHSPHWADFTYSARRHVKDYAKGASGDRYTAINTCPDETFELRIFASSLNQQEVQAALALAAASVEYTRALTVADIATHGGWDWTSFAHWVDERPQYAPLAREMERLSCVC